ncbi:MAG TPA: hypothetical protein VJW55_20105, partial [Candidatus Angelobacter sp.]|nr:hypothetical protein [Candidatus Angelobacter sp.]
MAPAKANVSAGEDEFITIARVARTQGRKGEVAAALLTDFPERFATRKKLFALCDAAAVKRNSRLGPAGQAPKRELELFARRRELELEDHWFHKGMVVLKFAGVDS